MCISKGWNWDCGSTGTVRSIKFVVCGWRGSESEEVGLVMQKSGAEKVGVEGSEVRHFCLGRHRWGVCLLKTGVWKWHILGAKQLM